MMLKRTYQRCYPDLTIISYDHDDDDHNYQQADDNGVIRIVVAFNSRKQLGTCSRAGILELLSLSGMTMRMMMIRINEN